MRDLHLHLTSGMELAFRLDDDVAAAAVKTWRDFRSGNGRFGADPLLEFGEDDGIDSWVPLAQVVAVQSYPAADAAPDQQEKEVAADGGS